MTNEVIAALTGGAIGAACTGMVTYVLEEGKRCIRRKGICLSLATELQTLWTQHTRNCGAALMALHAEDRLNSRYALSSDYFTSYHANAATLGDLKDDEIRDGVVQVYTQLKGLSDSFKLYDQIQIEDQLPPNIEEMRPNIAQGHIDRRHARFVDYTLKLKAMNGALDASIPSLVKKLRNYAEIL